MILIPLFLGLQSKSISFENPGIRLELFLKELSKQSGQGFHCPTYLNNEVLAASFKDQSIDILKTQLARVIHGTWEQKEDGWWLVQTSEQKKEEQQWVWTERNKMLQFQIDGLKEIVPKSEWTIKDAEKFWLDTKDSRRTKGEGVWTRGRRIALRLQSPEFRLCARITSKLTVDMLIENPLKFNDNLYSNHGLPGHVELPINCDEALRQYWDESQLFKAVAESDNSNGAPAHLEIQYYSSDREFLLFRTLDKNWKYVGNYLPTLSLPDNKHQVHGEDFPVSDELRQILAMAKELNFGSDSAPIFEKYKSSPILAEAVATMVKATQHDPLGIIQGRCWIEFSKYCKRPLLVNLKDDEAIIRPALEVPTLKQDGLVIGMMRCDADGWTLGRPINPLFNRSWRLDRFLIEEYARLTKVPNTHNFLPLLRISTIIDKINHFSKGIPNSQFLLDDRHPSGSLSGILGTLDEAQIDQCLRGARIPVSMLPQLGEQLLSIMAHDGELNDLTSLNLEDPGQYCPLYCMPQGVQGITLGASLKTDFEFRFETEPVEYFGNTLDLQTFADLLASAPKDSDLFGKNFKVGSKRIFVATAYRGDKSKTEEISDPIADPNLPTYTWKTLPDDIRQKVLDLMMPPKLGILLNDPERYSVESVNMKNYHYSIFSTTSNR